MSQLRAFFEYAQAFELAFLSDDWSVIASYFDDHAEHVVTNGGPHDRNDRGRDQVVNGFREAIHTLDRRFDLRIPEILDGPSKRDGGIWMRFRLTHRRSGLPDLSIEGEHLARYDGEKIVSIEERVLGDGGQRSADYLARHQDRLRPPTTGPLDTTEAENSEALRKAMMRTLVRGYGAAKSQQDIAASLSVCHPSFSIETVSFAIASRDKAETADHLALFFDAFPDYCVTTEGLMAEGDQACLWGRARMTLAGDGLGVPATGLTADLPIFCVFGFRDGLLASERFFFDLADLCNQIGVPVETVTQNLAAFRSQAA